MEAFCENLIGIVVDYMSERGDHMAARGWSTANDDAFHHTPMATADEVLHMLKRHTKYKSIPRALAKRSRGRRRSFYRSHVLDFIKQIKKTQRCLR